MNSLIVDRLVRKEQVVFLHFRLLHRRPSHPLGELLHDLAGLLLDFLKLSLYLVHLYQFVESARSLPQHHLRFPANYYNPN